MIAKSIPVPIMLTDNTYIEQKLLCIIQAKAVCLAFIESNI